eukprot:jgi/Orpsp1_1/1186020/evm.model.c7180000096503.1
MNLKYIFSRILLNYSLFSSLVLARQHDNDCIEIETYLEERENKYSSFALYECIVDDDGKVFS